MTNGATLPSGGVSGLRTRFAGFIAPALSPERSDRLARTLGLRSALGTAGGPADGRTGPGPLALLVTDGTTAAADSLWLPPVAAWVEPAAGDEDGGGVAALLAEASGTDLYVNLTTATAHDLHLGGRLLTAIGARHPLSGHRRDDIELALHEAVSNALVHGNLGVGGMKELSAQELERFSRDLGDGLADPVLAARRIAIAVRIDPPQAAPAGPGPAGSPSDGAAENRRALATVEITDQGAGFVPGRHEQAGASGRGLDLIGSIADGLEIEDGGRCIRLRFRL
ncbi:ATP-binding protein [Azospirillum humicireducens]|uniref:ATP-binding protein n=1 Tax=Azospirillum humicireducens TaxID=1226968 RepID=A0A168Y7Y9_9PROT|nr:ATP-binding protein [Azospirillum humicireducens]ANC92137.1 ATP-binding protein [Azospirillum humicireducens]